MAQQSTRPFPQTPRTVAGHFGLCLYAAIYRLLFQIQRMTEPDPDGIADEASDESRNDESRNDKNDKGLDDFFLHFPFLAQYFDETCDAMPEEITWEQGGEWWQSAIEAWESECDFHLPLRALSEQLGLSNAQRLAFMLTGLVEEDSRFGTLFAELQSPLTNRRPTLELIGQLVMEQSMAADEDPWSICRPLLQHGLIETPNQQVPRSEWLLRVPPLLWDAVRGQFSAELAEFCRHESVDQATPLTELIAPADFTRRLSQLPVLVERDEVRLLVLRGLHGAPIEETFGAVAHSLGRGIVQVEAKELQDSAARHLLGPLCTLLHAIPVIEYELGPGETADPASLSGYEGLLGVALGMQGGLSSEINRSCVTLNLPHADAEQRRRFWLRELDGHPCPELEPISQTFQLAGGLIKRVARTAIATAALDGRDQVLVPDVQEASRWLNRQLLDTLADRVETSGRWEELVTSPLTAEKLRELERRCRCRERIGDRLGSAFGSVHNRGVRALLIGASGTGKTLAAKVLANELGMDLYRVDLASVVNKYIGETEKNLNRVLSRAEALDVVLLLDEGDALLGQRTEVRSANDRYANLETNYLLQRLENYQGIVVVTTNLGDAIDQGFQRRMDVVVPFLPPRAEERLEILRLHLPADHEISEQTLQQVAAQCRLTGGQLRNAVLLGVLLAMDDGDNAKVKKCHLEAALRSEYRKAGATFPFDNIASLQDSDGGFEAFRSALNANTDSGFKRDSN